MDRGADGGLIQPGGRAGADVVVVAVVVFTCGVDVVRVEAFVDEGEVVEGGVVGCAADHCARVVDGGVVEESGCVVGAGDLAFQSSGAEEVEAVRIALDDHFAGWGVGFELVHDFVEAAKAVCGVEGGEDALGDLVVGGVLVEVGCCYDVAHCCVVSEGWITEGDGF